MKEIVIWYEYVDEYEQIYYTNCNWSQGKDSAHCSHCFIRFRDVWSCQLHIAIIALSDSGMCGPLSCTLQSLLYQSQGCVVLSAAHCSHCFIRFRDVWSCQLHHMHVCCWCRILELTTDKNISHGRMFQIVYTGIIPGKAHTSPLQLSSSTSCLYLEHHLGHYLLWLIAVVVRSASIRLLGLRVWIPVGVWIFVCCVCCVLSR